MPSAVAGAAMSVAPAGPTKMPGVVGVPPLEPASEALPDELVVPDDAPVPPLEDAWPADDPEPELDVAVDPLPLDEAPPIEPEPGVPPPLAPAPEEPEEAVEDASSPVEAPFAPPPRSS